jgi:hypothetical protein
LFDFDWSSRQLIKVTTAAALQLPPEQDCTGILAAPHIIATVDHWGVVYIAAALYSMKLNSIK